MDHIPEILRNKVAVALTALILFVVVGFSGIFLLASSLANPHSESSKTSLATSTTKPKSSTTTSTTSTTTSSTTTTTRPSAVAAAAATTTADTTTTTAPVFTPTATAQKTDENEIYCSFSTYTFSGSISSNVAGDVTYEWIRWDDQSTGISGTVTVNGNVATTVTPLQISVFTSQHVSGWVALKLTYDGGTTTSAHAPFEFVLAPGSLLPATGC